MNTAPFDLFPPAFQRLERLAAGGRQEELRASRRCAAQILASLGCADTELARDPGGVPVWPRGYTGSITHTRELVAVVARPCTLSRSVGIDAEALVDEADAARIERYCLAPGELEGLGEARAMPRRELVTLLFSAKEAFFKCLHPGGEQRFTPFESVAESADPCAGTLRLRHGGHVLEGSFRFEHGHVFTAFELAAAR